MTREKIIKEGLELLLKEAKTTQDFKDIQIYIDDYLEQGFNVKEFISKLNTIYTKFLTNYNGNKYPKRHKQPTKFN